MNRTDQNDRHPRLGFITAWLRCSPLVLKPAPIRYLLGIQLPRESQRMATFYVLPPRSILDAALSEVLTRYLPGLPLPAEPWNAVAGELAAAANWMTDTYVVHRDDLPDDETIASALADGFGAEPGDHVVEISTRMAPRSWTIASAAVSDPSAAR